MKARFGKLFPVLVASGVLLAGCGGGGGGGSDDLGRDGGADIQGGVNIASGSRVDSDYASLWWADEDSWTDARNEVVEMPVPGAVGGFLSSFSGEYSNGRRFPEDLSDKYTLTLFKGDRLRLQCFPAAGNDAQDLEVSILLGDSPGGTPGDACGPEFSADEDLTNVEVKVSTSGGGPFRYVLSVAPQWSFSSLDVRWPEPDLRVGEAIVADAPAAASSLSASGLRAGSAMEQVRSLGPDTWQVRQSSGVSALSVGSATGVREDPRAETIEWIRELREEYGLKAEPNYLVALSTASPETNDYYNTEKDGLADNWNLKQIKMPEAWPLDGSNWGYGVRVAVMDNGLFSYSPESYGDWHEDLVGNIADAGDRSIWDFVSENYDRDDEPGPDGNPATPIREEGVSATSFHGTHVAGIIAAQDNSVGTVGIAHKSTILPYRVLGTSPLGDEGAGTTADIIDAINDATQQGDVDVINLSLGASQPGALQTAIDEAHESGILMIAAAGNLPAGLAMYPAASRHVVGVGATNRYGERSDISNYGRSVDILAPGGDYNHGIVNAYGPSDDTSPVYYARLAGTSMSAPHVTGVFALLKSLVDNYSADQFRAQLIAGNLSNGALGNYALNGAGMLDAEVALGPNRLAFPTVVSAWPRVLALNPSGAESEVMLEVLKKNTENNPEIARAPEIPDKVSVTDKDGNQLASAGPLPEQLRVSVDSDLLEVGRALAETVVIPYSAEGGVERELRIPVYVQAQDDQSDRNAGIHYVVLIDAVTRQVAYSERADYVDGKYSYSFKDVEPGDYYLVTSSDLDNNGRLCENGEACGEYLGSDGYPQMISYRDGQSLRFDLTTSFHRAPLIGLALPRYGFNGYQMPDSANGSKDIGK